MINKILAGRISTLANKLLKAGCENNSQYKFFLVSQRKNKIMSAWSSYEEASSDIRKIYSAEIINAEKAKIVTREGLKDINISPSNVESWSETYSIENEATSAKKSMNYGTLPNYEEFLKHYRKIMGDTEYTIKHGITPLITPEGSYTAEDLFERVKILVDEWEKGNDGAGDEASSILYTLDFEWV